MLQSKLIYILVLSSILIDCKGSGGVDTKTVVEVEKYVTPQLDMPIVNSPAGTYAADLNLTLSAPVGGATVYYTTDGSEPTAASPVYSAPIPINAHGTTVTVKAYCSLSGFLPSRVFTGVYSIQYGQIADVAISPAAGTYAADQSIALSTTTTGAAVYYTTDGSTPTTGSTLYVSAIALNGNGSTLNLKARAFKTGMLASNVATSAFSINYAATSAPNINLSYATNSATVTISTATSGATIRYTVDGSTPTPSAGTIYASGFNVTQNTTVKAIAYKSGLLDSTVTTTAAQFTVASPVVTPASQTSFSPQQITMTTTTSGAQIRYTIDGSTPSDTVGTIYGGSFTLNSSATLKAIAYKSGWTNSSVTTNNYTIQLANPFFLTEPGTYCRAQNVGFHTVSQGATIRYTTDGSTPSSSVGTVYTTPFAVSSNTTIKAIAYKAGFLDSTVISGNYVFSGCFVAGSDYGQFFKSTDGGQSWKAWPPVSSDIGAIASDGQGNLVLTTATSSNAFSSRDGGRNWTRRSTDVRGASVAYSPSGIWISVSNTCGSNGIWKSTAADASAWAYGTAPNPFDHIRSVTYLQGTGFIVLARNCTSTFQEALLRSTDGTTWTQIYTGTIGEKVYAAEGKLIIYGYTTRVSTDGGASWVAPSMPGASALKDVKYRSGRFVGVGNLGTIVYSDDGMTWTVASSGTSANFVGIDYLNGKYVAAAANGYMYYSTDSGVTWTMATPPTVAIGVIGLTAAYDRLVAFGSKSLIYTSFDGINWSLDTHVPASPVIHGMALGMNKRLIVSSAQGMLFSDDGNIFTHAFVSTDEYLDVAHDGIGKLSAAGRPNKAILSTDNGATWVQQGMDFWDDIAGMASDGNKFFAAEWSYRLYSSDVAALSWATSIVSPAQWEDIHYANNQLVLAGYYGRISYSNDHGANWQAATITGISSSVRLTGLVYGLGKWVSVGYSGKVYYSTDAAAWNFGSHGSSNSFEELAFGDGRFVAVGQGGYTAYSSDGINWLASSVNVSTNLYSVVHIPYP